MAGAAPERRISLTRHVSERLGNQKRPHMAAGHVCCLARMPIGPGMLQAALEASSWAVFEVEDAPPMTITKSSDSRFLVGGQSPKGLNDLIEVGIKTTIAAIVAGIPFIGPVAAEIIKGGGEMLSKMAADKFLVLNEFTDKARKQYHGRSGYISVAKPGAGNSIETLQKAWQAKSETAGDRKSVV